jgi:hypothetical protein
MKRIEAILTLLFAKQFVLLTKNGNLPIEQDPITQTYNVDELDKLDMLIRTEEGAMERLNILVNEHYG